jgi:LmbE family N-acetylglucosaminyl deacetylase
MSKAPHPRVVVLSPHLDDAVLSCAGRIGPHATVVTMFAGVPGPDQAPSAWDRACGAESARELMLRRRGEDADAVGALGGRTRHLDFLELAYRARPPQGRALLLAVLEEAAGADEVWFPAAVGGHLDHLILREVLARATRELTACAMRMYADYPYVNHLVAGARRRAGDPHRATSEVLTAWARRWLEPPEGAPCVPGLDAAHLDPATLAAKHSAVRAYASQFEALEESLCFGRLLDGETLATEYSWIHS